MSPALWRTLVRALGGVFLLLGLLFVGLPGPASRLFGIPAEDGTALAYVRAIGLRDLALALYLLWLAPSGARTVLAASLVIPAGDLVLVLAGSGLSTPLPLALHALSGLVLAALAFTFPRSPG